MEELIVLTKSMKVSFNLYLFLILSIISFASFAGVDPDEVALEDDVKIQEVVKKEVVTKETVTTETFKKAEQEVALILDGCRSFPEAVAFKEHFACHADIEKLRLSRLNWSFAKLSIRD